MEILETRHRFIELRAKGYSYDKIATELQVNKHTLLDWSRQFEQDIANYRAVELEQLFDSYMLIKEHRVKHLGRILSKLQAEVERRDLSQLQTDKLLEILLKYGNQLREELEGPLNGPQANRVEVVIKRQESNSTLNKMNTLNKLNT